MKNVEILDNYKMSPQVSWFKNYLYKKFQLCTWSKSWIANHTCI